MSEGDTLELRGEVWTVIKTKPDGSLLLGVVRNENISKLWSVRPHEVASVMSLETRH